ncbi:MAG: ComEC/Rec2 family competence protein [Pyrinomonadaceae bacterium]
MRAVPHKDSCFHYPLMVLAWALACGIFAATFIGAQHLMICLACGVLSGALALLCLARFDERAVSVILVLAFFGAGMTLELAGQGSLKAFNRVARLYEQGIIASGDPVEVTGVVEQAPEPAADVFYMTLRIESLRAKETERAVRGRVWLVAPVSDGGTRAAYESLELRYGARLRVLTRLRREESFRNPGVASSIEYLDRRGFDAQGLIKSPLLIERLDDERVFWPLARVYEWRQRLLAEIGDEFSTETAGVLQAALLGDRYLITRGAAERFRAGGTFHVLVISGLHISFIGFVALWIARRLTKRRAWQFAATVTFLWAYALGVGAGASVVRAALMFTTLLLAPVLHRRAQTFNTLGGACLALLVWRPADLFDPSFQLTFLSVLSIAAIAWPLIEKLRAVGAWRPSRETPYPPVCPRWFRVMGETLYWSERGWRREMERAIFRCKLFKTPLAMRLEWWRMQRCLRYAVGAVIVSASVQIGMLPFLVIYFHRISFASLVLNIFVAAMMAAESLIALVTLFVTQASTQAAAPLAALVEKLNWLMIHSVDPFANARVAFVRVPEYTGRAAIIYGVYYVPLGLLVFALARWNPLRRDESKDQANDQTKRRAVQFLEPTRVAAVVFVVTLCLIVAHPLSARRPDGKLRIDFLDVGQGDAALVTMPDGTTLLIDAGGRPRIQVRKAADADDEEFMDEAFERDTRSIGEAVVAEYLWWRGLDRVDYILATHADADHINGFNDIARNFKVGVAIVARAPAANAEYARFASSMRENGVPVRLIGRGDVLHFGKVTADVLWPVYDASMDAPSRNNDSIVLRLRFGSKTFLLTGDMEKEAEDALLAARDDLHCDVVKVAHHGSKTSSTQEFVAATRPALSVVSVGLNSPFNHPNRDVVERWRASNAQVLTTGKSGTITVSTNGQSLDIETFVKR